MADQFMIYIKRKCPKCQGKGIGYAFVRNECSGLEDQVETKCDYCEGKGKRWVNITLDQLLEELGLHTIELDKSISASEENQRMAKSENANRQ